MTHQVIARDLLAVLCAVQGLVVMAVDLNYNHARSSLWSGHARFHVVWKAAGFAGLALVEIALLFIAGPLAQQRFYLAAVLTAVPMFGFFMAFLGRSFYGGMMADVHVVPPASFRIFRASFLVDMNVAAEVAAALTLILIVLLYRHT